MSRFIGHDQMTRTAMRKKTLNDDQPGMFRGTEYISGKQLAEERAFEQERKLQELKNKGLIDVANITGSAGTEQQRLRNIGLSDVANIDQSSQTERTNILADIDKQKNLFNQYKALRELEQNINAPARYSYIPGWQEYQKTALGQTNTGTSTGNKKYDSVTRSDGTVEYYDKAGNLAYSDKPKQTTPNVPGSTLQSYGEQSVWPRSENNTATPFMNTNFAHYSGLRGLENTGAQINTGLRNLWRGSTWLGNQMIDRGIKPVYQWAMSPYQR